MRVNGLAMVCFVVISSLVILFFVYRPQTLVSFTKPAVVQTMPAIFLATIRPPLRLDQTVRILKDDPNSPLASLRKNGYSKKLPSLDELQRLDTSALWTTFHSYLDNMDIVCDRKLRMGNIADGGWEICDDPPVRPVKPCIVYSFGINNDFSFDNEVVRLYECNVYSFDPRFGHFRLIRSKGSLPPYKNGSPYACV
ncbi:uncharacterized protein LOC121392339 isoform X2 [Gigantopelta aegis]|uniref:uncharacterized protein LOC121392339 isoform X2 n=1 Tax=Gigantopelta aegis TaxID=1735272 RepID=UPI001B889315|nr:uncharacterized protein LOC121392339 isoform X2 [Gigantopelta aegis]XP_041379515.1 uncharacterized protein LOC121392339 isoform X2 [Gigantopelta aegis]XP_041379517.1 uncharacterized protein LOC121392339 isoform X2 [Gigantopelta aegis]